MLALRLVYQEQYENHVKSRTQHSQKFYFYNIEAIKDPWKSVSAIDLTRGINSLFVNCDILKPSLVGDTFAQLLRVVPVHHATHFGETIANTFDEIHYYALNSRQLQTIEIIIKDDAGETIIFRFGRVYLKLHFKKI